MTMLKKQRRIDTDNRIKDAAIVLFAEHGYEGAQLSYISKLAGISNGLIVQNFGGKQELFMAVVRDGYDNLHKVFNSIGENKSWEEYLKGLLEYFKSGMNDEKRKKRIAFTSTIANSKDTPPCYLEESVKELEKTPVADALRVGQKNGEVKDGHPGILYARFFRTACNIIVACNKNNIALPEDEWFLSLVRK
jgi:AcrR family transcriptional regulator